MLHIDYTQQSFSRVDENYHRRRSEVRLKLDKLRSPAVSRSFVRSLARDCYLACAQLINSCWFGSQVWCAAVEAKERTNEEEIFIAHLFPLQHSAVSADSISSLFSATKSTCDALIFAPKKTIIVRIFYIHSRAAAVCLQLFISGVNHSHSKQQHSSSACV